MCLVGTPGSLPPSLMCSLCTLVQWTFSGSSVQATIPFTMLQDMNILLECDSISDIQERLRVDRKLYCRLKSCLGQPVVVDIFLHLHTCTESQSKVVIKFLSHLTKNVSYSLPSPDLQLVQDKVSSCYYNMFGSQPAQREVSMSHKETTQEQSERLQQELRHGILYWGCPPVAQRPRYEMDKQASGTDINKSQESVGCEESCGKRFARKGRQTGQSQGGLVCFLSLSHVLTVHILSGWLLVV
jgi:hypothetical protein